MSADAVTNRRMTEAPPMRTDDFQIGPVRSKAVLRLKSWLPEHLDGNRRALLGERELPSQVGSTLAGSVPALCLGPGEWLVVSHEHAASQLREQSGSDLAEQGIAMIDLSDGIAAFDVSGPLAREVLSKGCGLDFHPSVFRIGHCARTRFAQVPLVIDLANESPCFDLYVARSYLSYLRSWLTDAAAEFRSSSI